MWRNLASVWTRSKLSAAVNFSAHCCVLSVTANLSPRRERERGCLSWGWAMFSCGRCWWFGLYCAAAGPWRVYHDLLPFPLCAPTADWEGHHKTWKTPDDYSIRVWHSPDCNEDYLWCTCGQIVCVSPQEFMRDSVFCGVDTKCLFACGLGVILVARILICIKSGSHCSLSWSMYFGRVWFDFRGADLVWYGQK